jgi:hypothetical protein
MTLSIQDLVKTDYYHPSLNSAVFDGPLRIYFSQSQEALALDLYFQLQKILEQYGYRSFDSSWYFVVLLYPSLEIYQVSLCKENTDCKDSSPYRESTFENQKMEEFLTLNLGQDKIILTHGQKTKKDFLSLVQELRQCLDQLELLKGCDHSLSM